MTEPKQLTMKGYRRNPGVVDAIQNTTENRPLICEVLADVHGGFEYDAGRNSYSFTQTSDRRLTPTQILHNNSWLVYDKASNSCLVYWPHDFQQLFTKLT